MARIKRLGEVYSAGDVRVTVAGIYDFDPTKITYSYNYAHEYQRGLKRKPRGWRMGQQEMEGSITLPLDIVADLEKKFGDIALIRPFPINITFTNFENEIIHDLVYAKFTGNGREVSGDGELERELDLFVLDVKLNIGI
jgi:hypothetical protein